MDSLGRDRLDNPATIAIWTNLIVQRMRGKQEVYV